MKFTRLATLASRPAALAALGMVGALALLTAWPAAGPTPIAQAQAPSCSATMAGAAAENQQAFVDVGAGNTATFVCISASAFPGGKSAPITTNGVVGDGCYIVEGLGTSVVAVYRESPSVKQCPDLVRIDVGGITGPASSPTATAPAPSPTATATAPLPTTTATAPAPTATATPTLPAPGAPTTGSGTSADAGTPAWPFALALVALGFGSASIAAAATRRIR
jgi:hypothetical protein